MAYAVRTNKMKRSEVDQTVLDIVDSDISTEDLRHFAETPRKSLPQHLAESLGVGLGYGVNSVFYFEYIDGDGVKKTEGISAPYFNAAKDEFEMKYPDRTIVHVKM